MFDELVSLVRRYALTPSIIELANFSYFLERKQQVVLKMEFDDPGLLKRKTVVSQFALAFLSAQMTLRANDFRDKKMSYNDILLLCNRYNNLETKTEENPTILSLLVRISQEQIPFQEVGFYHFARGYYLINDVSKREGYKNPLDLDRIFLEWCGLNIEDYYWIAWFINSIGFGKEPPVFNKEFFIKHSVKGLEHILTSVKLDKFLDINSATIDKIKDENNQINAKIPIGFEKYQFNILSRYPIIRLGKTASNFTDKSFLVTNSKLMMNKIVDGVYWGFRDLFLSKSNNQQGFVNFWGEIFEKYVGEILIQYYGQGKVSNLDDIGHKLGYPISDWLVVTNEEIFVFECKSSLLPLSIKGVFDQSEFKEWCTEHLFDGVKQLISTEKLVKEGKINLGITIEKKRIKKILVTYQNLYVTRHWEDLCKHICSEEKIQVDQDWHDNFYIMSVFELELFEKLSSRVSLGKILEDLRRLPEEDFLTICKRYCGEKLTNSTLASVKDKFWSQLEGVTSTLKRSQ